MDNALKIGCDVYIVPKDITSANEDLNLVFITKLFNANQGMGESTEEEIKEEEELLDNNEEEYDDRYFDLNDELDY